MLSGLAYLLKDTCRTAALFTQVLHKCCTSVAQVLHIASQVSYSPAIWCKSGGVTCGLWHPCVR